MERLSSVHCTGGAVRFASPTVQLGDNQVNIKTNGGNFRIYGGTDPTAPGYAQGLDTVDGYSAGVYFTNVNINTNGGEINVRGKSAANNSTGNEGIVAGIMSSKLQVLTMNSGTGKITLTGVTENKGTIVQSHGISLNGGTITSAKTSDTAIYLGGNASAVTGATSLAAVSLMGYQTSAEQIVSTTGAGGKVAVSAIGGKNAPQGQNFGFFMGSGTIMPAKITTRLGGAIEINGAASDYAVFIDRVGVLSTVLLDVDNYAERDSLIQQDTGYIALGAANSGSIYTSGPLITKGGAEFTGSGTGGAQNLQILGTNSSSQDMDSKEFYIGKTKNNISGYMYATGFKNVDIRNEAYTDSDYAPTQVGGYGIDATGLVRMSAGGGNLELASGIRISSSSTDTNAITLHTWENFVNNTGFADPIRLTGVSGTPRWIIYSNSPASNTFGTTTNKLKSNEQAVWGKDASEYNTIADSYTGNRYIFQVPGTLEFVGTGGPFNIEYGNIAGAIPASLTVKNNTTKTVSSNAEHTQYGSVFSAAYTGSPDFSGGTGSLLNVGLNQTATLSAGTTVLQGNVTATYYGSATVNVTPRTLTLALADQTKPFDGTSTATLKSTDFTLSGLVPGQSFTIKPTNGDYYTMLPTPAKTANAAEATLVAVQGISPSDFTPGVGTLASNYDFTQTANTSGKGTITPLTLIASIIGAPTKVYDRSSSIATLNPNSYQLVGLATPGAITINKTTGDFNSKDVATANLITTTLQNTDFTVAPGTLLSNYAFPTTASGAGSITKANLTVTGISTTNKEYDGTTATTVSAAGASFTGLVGSDTVTVGTTANFADKNAGIGKSILMTLGGADAGNYLGTATATADITKRPLTITGVSAQDKQYDRLLNAVVYPTAALVTGLLNPDVVTIAATGLFSDKNAGSGKTVALALAGPDAGNYSTTSTATAAISTKALTISGITAANKLSDGKIDATLSTSAALYTGLLAGDTVLLAATGKFSDSTPGSGKTVLLTSSYTGADVANYTITNQASTTADITGQNSSTVDAITSQQTGITGTANTATSASPIANSVLPGTGTSTVTDIPNRILIAAAPTIAPAVVAMPSQGNMTLSHSAGSNAVRLVESGATTTLSMGRTGAAPELPLNNNPAIPVYKVSANKPIAETALAVRFNDTSISGTTVGSSDTGLTSNAAISSASAAGTGLKTTTTTITMADGSSATMTVGLTAEGVLVVSVPGQTDATDNAKALSLVAMSAAKDALGISPDAVKGVLIQSDSKP